jgi:hypothetical protein
MNEKIWYHHPIVIAETVLYGVILVGLSIIIAIQVEWWIAVPLGTLVSALAILIHLIWVRQRSLTVTGKGRIAVKEPFTFSAKTYNPFIAQIDYHQSLLGRILDYGDVIFHFRDQDLQFRTMSRFCSLQLVLEDEQQRATAQAQHVPIINIFVGPAHRVTLSNGRPFRIPPDRNPQIIDGHFVNEEDRHAQ